MSLPCAVTVAGCAGDIQRNRRVRVGNVSRQRCCWRSGCGAGAGASEPRLPLRVRGAVGVAVMPHWRPPMGILHRSARDGDAANATQRRAQPLSPPSSRVPFASGGEVRQRSLTLGGRTTLKLTCHWTGFVPPRSCWKERHGWTGAIGHRRRLVTREPSRCWTARFLTGTFQTERVPGRRIPSVLCGAPSSFCQVSASNLHSAVERLRSLRRGALSQRRIYPPCPCHQWWVRSSVAAALPEVVRPCPVCGPSFGGGSRQEFSPPPFWRILQDRQGWNPGIRSA